MWSRGLSLVEMIIVMCLLSIILALATLGFNEMSRRYRSEAQTRLLFSEILKARNNAICLRRAIRVKVFPARFQIYSSHVDESGGALPQQTHHLGFPVTCSRTWSPEKGFAVDFSRDGIAQDNVSFCLQQGAGGVDSIKIYSTRVSIGKKDRGDDCDDGNITIR